MTSIKVAIKIRPLIQREKDECKHSQWTVLDEKTIKSNNKEYTCTFDEIFDDTRTTKELYDAVAKPIILSALEGINGAIFAYGQTSSGKTYCMMGDETEPGIIPLAIDEIFQKISLIQGHEFLIRVGYIEIYNEKMFDLLDESKTQITRISNNRSGEPVVEQIEKVVTSPEDILLILAEGNANRRIGETAMNEQSSRSHALFRIVIESKRDDCDDGAVKVSTLFLVDLAGSERADQTKATGERLREGGHINKSLLSLSKVIRELSEAKDSQYISFRDSKLTQILSTSLGGNAKTAIICTITPAVIEETYSTLTFANNAKKVKTRPKVNELLTDEAVMKRMRRDIVILQAQLEQERAKNSEDAIQVRLREKIFDRELVFIHSGVADHKQNYENRRRTWVCPQQNNAIEKPSRPVSTARLAPIPPFISNTNVYQTTTSNDDEFANEIFKSPSSINLDRTLSPTRTGRTTDDLMQLIHTPRSFKPNKDFLLDSPDGALLKSPEEKLQDRIKYLEEELKELNDFKLLEKLTLFTNDEVKNLQTDLQTSNDQLTRNKNEIDELKAIIRQKDDELMDLKTRVQLAENESKKALNQRQLAENTLASFQYEFDVIKEKSKRRENELLQSLEEARNDSKEHELNEKIKSLQEVLKKTEEDLFAYQSKNEDVKNKDEMSKKITELEEDIKLFKQDREEKKAKIASLEDEQIKLSDQLMEAIEESEKLQKDIDNLQKSFDTLKEENQKLVESSMKSTQYERIEEALKSGQINEESLAHFDIVGKIILKLHHDAVKTESLEVEKLQLQKDLDDIRGTVVELSQQLVASQSSSNCVDEELKSQVLSLSAELVETKSLFEDQVMRLCEKDDLIDGLKQQLENLYRENQNMKETFKDLEALEKQLESLNKAISERDQHIIELQDNLVQMQIDVPHHDKSTMSTSLNEICNSLELVAFGEEKINLQSQIEVLKNENKMLRIDLATSNSTIDDMQEKISSNLMTISNLEDKLTSKDDLQAEITNLSSEFAEIKNRVDSPVINEELEQAITKLNEDLQQASIEKEELSNQVVALNFKLSKAEVDYEKALSDNESLHKEIEKYKSEIDECEKSLKHALEEYHKTAENDKEIKDKLKENQQLIESLQGSLEKATKDNENFKSEIQTMTEKLANSSNEVETLKKHALEEKKSFEDNKKEFVNTESKLYDSQEQIESLQKEIREISLKLTNSSIEIDTLKKKALEDKEHYLKMSENDQEMTEKYKMEISDAKVKLSVNQQLIESLQNNLKKASNDSDNFKNEIQNMAEKLTKSFTEIETLKNKVLEEKENCRKMTENYEKEISDAKNELSESQELIESLQINLKTAKNEIQTMTDKLTKSYAEIETLKNNAKTLTDNLSECQELSEVYRNDYKSASHEYNEAKKEITKLTSENDRLTVEIRESLKVIATLEDRIKVISNEKSQFPVEFDKFGDLKAQKKENSELKIELEKTKKKMAEKNATIEELESFKQDIITSRNTKANSFNMMKEKFVKLEADYTNRQSEIVVLKEQNKELLKKIEQMKENMESVDKIKELEMKLNESRKLQASAEEECKEIKTRLRRRSKDCDLKLLEEEKKNKELLYRVGELEANKLSTNNEIKRWKETVDELKHKIQELNVEISTQTSTIFTNNLVIAELRQKVQEKSSTSPTTSQLRKSAEHEDQIYALQHKKLLVSENSTGTPIRTQQAKDERKARRQSTYENRRISLWEQFLSTSTQTDNFDCACNEMRNKIQELNSEIKKRDCQIKCYQHKEVANPVKFELQEAQRELTTLRRDFKKAKSELELEQQRVKNLLVKVDELKRNQKERVAHVHRGNQTSEEVICVEKSEYDTLESEKFGYQRQCNELSRKIRKLQESKDNFEALHRENQTLSRKIITLEAQIGFFEKLTLEKENVSQNPDAGTNATQPDAAAFEELKRKYSLAKRLCTVRMETIEEWKQKCKVFKETNDQNYQIYRNQMDEMEVELEQMHQNYKAMESKYKHAKAVCEFRLKKICELRGDPIPPSPKSETITSENSQP